MKAQERTTSENILITSRAEDFSKWYQDVIDAAELAENGPTKGSMILKPAGYSIWENIQSILNRKFKDLGISNVYFPMLIPERFLKKEEEHVEGFSPEVAVVTYAGGQKLEEGLVIRPTSETIIYDTFSRWIQSHRDLPLIINQWANVVRWEMRPRLFLRTTEFLWQEGHTAHATDDEADLWARKMLEVYRWFAEDVMAIPVFSGIKSEREKFSGALRTYSVEAMMQDGKALQFATSHHLGQNFAKAFDITFTDEDGTSLFAWQTSWGLSTRTIGGLIMTHGDDKGVIIPPNIAPIKAVIIPVWNSEETKEIVLREAFKLHESLINIYGNETIVIDDREIRFGQKHYAWEKKGVPVRIEIGPRDVDKKEVVLVRRDTSEKRIVSSDNITNQLASLLTEMQHNLFSKAQEFQRSNTVEVTSWNDFVKNIEAGRFVKAYWDENGKTEEKIKQLTKATIRCIPVSEESHLGGKCILSDKPAKKRVIFARSY